MKRTWVDYGVARDWTDDGVSAGEEFLEHATQVKTSGYPMGSESRVESSHESRGSTRPSISSSNPSLKPYWFTATSAAFNG